MDFLSSDTKISTISSGRLSFVFTAQQGNKKVFLKIVKPGLVHSNIPFSVMCTEQCRQYSDIPTFKTYPGKDGQYAQRVPSVLEDVEAKQLAFFKDQYITLTQAASSGIDTIPEQLQVIPGGRIGQLALMEKLGEYVVDVSLAVEPLVEKIQRENQLSSVDTSDPAGFRKNREVLMQVFRVPKEIASLLPSSTQQEANELQMHLEQLVKHLPGDSVAQSFKQGLLKGDLLFIIQRFNDLELMTSKSLSENPAKNVPIHNEVKPANVGAIYDEVQQQWTVTQSFDYDNIAWGNDVNGDATPIEKDLGRTISFFAFDPNSGEFLSENAFAVCKGFLKQLKRELSASEIDRLILYIQLGVVTSYLWRSSYFAEVLGGEQTDIELDRLDPSIHVKQLQSFDQWLAKNNFAVEFEKLY